MPGLTITVENSLSTASAISQHRAQVNCLDESTERLEPDHEGNQKRFFGLSLGFSSGVVEGRVDFARDAIGNRQARTPHPNHVYAAGVVQRFFKSSQPRRRAFHD